MNSLISKFLLFGAGHQEVVGLILMFLKSSLIFLVVWLIGAWLWRRSARARSWLWRIAFVGLTWLFCWQWLGVGTKASTWTVQVEALQTVELSTDLGTQTSPKVISDHEDKTAWPPPKIDNQRASIQISRLPGNIWLKAWLLSAGCLILWSCLRGWLGWRWLRQNSTVLQDERFPVQKQNSQSVRICVSLDTPVLAGWFKPEIYLPEKCLNYDQEALQTIFWHELAHWRRGDLWWQRMAGLICCLWWWQPLVWLAKRRLREEAEQAADDAVLLQCGVPADYAELLLKLGAEQTVRSGPISGLPMLGESPLGKRIKEILKTNNWRGRIGAGTGLLLVLLLLGVLVIAGCNVGFKAKPYQSDMAQDLTHAGSLTVKVVDELGKPMAGAELQPYGLREEHSPGSFYGWSKNTKLDGIFPTAAVTNPNGVAKIIYPLTVIENWKTIAVVISVKRPGFCPTVTEIGVLNPRDITLQKGTQVLVNVTEPEGSKLKSVLADVQDLQGNIQIHGLKSAKRLQSVVLTPKGEYAVRAVAFDEQGQAYFSGFKRIVTNGEKGEQLSFALQPGLSIKGRLDESVPRPVRDGIVTGLVVSPLEGNADVNQMPVWEVFTTIKEDGSFELKNLPPDGAVLSVIVLADGFVSKDPLGGANGNVHSPQQFKFNVPQPITVWMEPTGSIRIKVRQPNDQPLAGAVVGISPNQAFGHSTSIIGTGFNRQDYLRWLWDIDEGKDVEFVRKQHDDQIPFTSTTDKNGEAVIHNVPAGVQRLYVFSPPYELPFSSDGISEPRRDVRMQVVAGQESVQEVKLVPEGQSNSASPSSISIKEQRNLDPWHVSFPVDQTAHEFSGQILTPDGKPLEGVLVKAWNMSGDERNVHMATTNSNGEFVVPGATAARPYRMVITKAGYCPIVSFLQIAGRLQPPLTMSNDTSVKGVINDSQGQPVEGATVTAILNAGQDIQFQTTTDKGGEFLLYLAPGNYSFSVKKGAYGGGLNNAPIAEGQSLVLHLVMDPLLKFVAVVKDGITGAPVAGVSIKDRNGRIDTVTDAAGKITVDSLTAGAYPLTIDAEKLGYLGVSASQPQGSAVMAMGVSEKLLNINLTAMTPQLEFFIYKAVVIKGRIVGPDDQPQQSTVGYLRSFAPASATATDAAGNFIVKVPVAGPQNVRLVAEGNQKWAAGYSDVLAVKPGDVVDGITIGLTRPCVVEGKVVDQNNVPVAGKRVRVFTLMEGNKHAGADCIAMTDADGIFFIKGCGPGKHYVQVEPFSISIPNGVLTITPAIAEVVTDPDQPIRDIKLIYNSNPDR
jgi:beta-lactamase regulating signal transducer with metallopeptidase domain/protocatechuate 3,4-dioxygenase beta subunit